MLQGPRPKVSVRPSAQEEAADVRVLEQPFSLAVAEDAIVRVAAECAEDLAADGLVYAEVRYAPELSTERGLTLDEVVAATLEGFSIGARNAEAAGHPIVMTMLVTAMRTGAHVATPETARANNAVLVDVVQNRCSRTIALH